MTTLTGCFLRLLPGRTWHPHFPLRDTEHMNYLLLLSTLGFTCAIKEFSEEGAGTETLGQPDEHGCRRGPDSF